MSLKASPVPRNPRATRAMNTSGISSSIDQSILCRLDKASLVDTCADSVLQNHSVGLQSHGTYSPSEVIVPFNFDFITPLLSTESGQTKKKTVVKALSFGEDDILRLQMGLLDYVEGLNYSLRSLFTHENENMIEVLQQTRDVPITHIFFQTQKELRQLIGDDSFAKDRERIQRLSDLLEE